MSPSESSKKSGGKRGGSRGALGPIRMEGLSDIGRAPGNEDRYLSREIRVGSGRTAYLIAVADGAKADRTLSSPAEIAIQALDHRIQEDWDAFTDLERARAFLRLTFVAANAAIVSECGAGKAYTTLTVAVIIDGELLVAHVGDSRCYLVTSRKIKQLTHDHNSIAQELEKGASRDQAKGSASQASGDLLRKLGDSAPPEVDFEPAEGPGVSIEEGSFILLCTDGVTGLPLRQHFKPQAIQQTLYGTFDTMAAVNHLISLSYKKGSRGNLTAVALEYGRAQRGQQIDTLPRIDELRRRQRTTGVPGVAEAPEAPAKSLSEDGVPGKRPSVLTVVLIAALMLVGGSALGFILSDSLRESEDVATPTAPPAFGGLHVTSIPPGADVHVDGRKVGVTDYEFSNIPPGVKTVRLELKGFEPLEREVKVEGGMVYGFTAEMVPQVSPENVAEIVVSTNPVRGATVVLDDRVRGLTPITIPGVQPGVHDLKLWKEGYRPKEIDVRADPGESQEVDLTLDPLPATLRVETDPQGARISLDNQAIGEAPVEKMDVAPGTYRIEAILEGHEVARTDVILGPGAATGVVLTMVPEAPPVEEPPGILDGVAEVEALLEKNLPLRARQRWERLVLTGLDPKESGRVREVRQMLGDLSPAAGLTVRFGAKDAPVLTGTPLLGSSPTVVPAKASPDGTYTVEVSPAAGGAPRLCLVQFALNRGKSYRLLPDSGRIPIGSRKLLPPVDEAWSSKYRRGDREVYLFLLLSVPGDLSLADLDARVAKAAVAAEDPVAYGQELLASMEEWLDGRGQDYALSVVWMADRTAEN